MSTAATPAKARLELLYGDHHGWLVGWLRRRLGCPHSAADLAQDAFMRLWGALERPGSSAQALAAPRAYLTTTASRLLIDEARRAAIEKAYLAALAATQPAEASTPSPQEVLETVQALSAIAALLDGLPEKAVRAFLMYRLDGLPQGEIAAALGVSASRVKQYVAEVMLHCYLAVHGQPAR